jgi:hypothetical protein
MVVTALLRSSTLMRRAIASSAPLVLDVLTARFELWLRVVVLDGTIGTVGKARAGRVMPQTRMFESHHSPALTRIRVARLRSGNVPSACAMKETHSCPL